MHSYEGHMVVIWWYCRVTTLRSGVKAPILTSAVATSHSKDILDFGNPGGMPDGMSKVLLVRPGAIACSLEIRPSSSQLGGPPTAHGDGRSDGWETWG